MKKVLLVIDMQKDFIDGSLGTKEAVSIKDKVVDYIKKFSGDVIYTRDTHFSNYLDTSEGKKLPVVHCIKDSDGWQINKDVFLAGEGKTVKVFDKYTFGSDELALYLKDEKYEDITLIGLCTDICVISNALLAKAFLPESKISVVSSCCAGVTVESHNNALNAMKMCQIDILD